MPSDTEQSGEYAQRVYKYRLPSPNEEPFVEMPKDAELLDVAAQDGIPYVWALIRPGQPLVRRYIRVYATGEPVDGSPDFVGTFRIDWTVWHVFAGGQHSAEPSGSYVPPTKGSSSG